MAPRGRAWLAVRLALAGAALSLANQAPYESPPEDLPRAVGPQPVSFDHRLHAENRIVCADCHGGATAQARAGLPGRGDCMLCHETIAADRDDVRLLAAWPADRRIPWERVYRVPDFVFFSHAEHAAAGIACAVCHGPVETRSELSQEVSTNMVACMNCHAQLDVSNECYLCHDLGQ